jgi:ribosomal RNA-processing protein 8
MFAVPGWSVVAPLKTQSETITTTNKDQKKSKSLKRKRSGPQATQDVTTENVEELWGRHIAKNIEEDAPKKKKHKNKHKKDKAVESKDEAQEDGQPRLSKKPPLAKTLNKSTHDDNVKPDKKEEKDKKKKTNQKLHPNALSSTSASSTTLTPLQGRMAAKLSSARFRHLSEQLYTTPSSTSKALFTTSPDLFAAYHEGFRQQVAVWPSNPVTGLTADVRRRAKNNSLPQGRKGTSILADLGCGDASLAASLVGKGTTKSFPSGGIEGRVSSITLRIHSFDLHAPNNFVTPADIAALPLPSGSVDVAIFCLALMGTNWPSFIDESWRILRDRGELWIAEIKSRFARVGGSGTSATKKIGTLRPQGAQQMTDKEKIQAEQEAILVAEVDGGATGAGRDSTDVSAFVALLRTRGFELTGSERESVDLSNKMFVKMRFVKTGRSPIRGRNAGQGAIGAVSDEARFGRVKKKKRFLEDVDNEVVPEAEEAKILKPCVYKLR